MKPTQSQLEAAKTALKAKIGNKTGVSYVGVGRGELRVGYRPDHLSVEVPSEVDGVPVRLVRTGEITARDVMRTLR